MKNKDAAIFFDKFAGTFNSFYENKRNPMMQWIDKKFRNDIFLRFALTFDNLIDIQNKTILDVGCGSGIYLFECLKRGAKFVTGVDSAKGMISLAEHKLSTQTDFIENYNLISGDFLDVAVKIHDYTIVMGVMDYVDEPIRFLKKLKEKTGTAVLISFPSSHWFRTPIRKVRYKLRSCPVYFYDENKIRSLAHLSGFKQIVVTKIPGAGLDYFVRLDNV